MKDQRSKRKGKVGKAPGGHMCDQGLSAEWQGVGTSIVLVEVSQAPRLLLVSSRLSHLYQVSPLPGMWRKFLIYGPSSFSSYSICKSAIS